MNRKLNPFDWMVALVTLLICSACTVKVNKSNLNSTAEYVLTLTADCGGTEDRFAFFEEAQNPQVKIQTGKIGAVNGQQICGIDASSALVELVDLTSLSKTEFPQTIVLKTSPVELANLGRAGVACLKFMAQDGVSGALIGELSVLYNSATKNLDSLEGQLSLMTHKAETLTDVGNGGFIKECR